MERRYAADTEVGPDRSRAEIERTLVRYGADAFGYAREGEAAVVSFRLAGRFVRIRVPLPARDDPAFTQYTQGKTTFPRSPNSARELYEKAVRQRWRALALVVKAKLETVASGISTIDREFLPDVVLPNGQTVGDWTVPQIAAAYERGEMPKLLPGANEASR
jgi:hypothetical protein